MKPRTLALIRAIQEFESAWYRFGGDEKELAKRFQRARADNSRVLREHILTTRK